MTVQSSLDIQSSANLQGRCLDSIVFLGTLGDRMVRLKIALVVAALAALAGLVSCTGSDKDEKKTDASAVAAARQVPAQQKPEGKDADEDKEEGVPNPAAAKVEKPAPLQTSGQQLIYDFDRDTTGQLPAKFHSARMGQGSESKWAVMADPTAPSKPNVVTQTSTDATDYRFPLLIADEASLKDLEMSVKFKAVSGRVDQASGLVFRLKDPNNYYIVRANALEDNYRLYHVIDGRRRQFAGANFRVTPGVWHELRVVAVGNKYVCYYDGERRSKPRTILSRMRVKWAFGRRADSATSFDDLKIVAK